MGPTPYTTYMTHLGGKMGYDPRRLVRYWNSEYEDYRYISIFSAIKRTIRDGRTIFLKAEWKNYSLDDYMKFLDASLVWGDE